MVCPHFKSCGGCSTQDQSYESQLLEKGNRVRGLLSEFSVRHWSPILPSPEIQFYRNKMEYSFGNERDIAIFESTRDGDGRVLGLRSELSQVTSSEHPPVALLDPVRTPLVHVGLHPRKRFALVMPTPECQLLSLEGQKITALVSKWANEFHVTSFVRKSAQGDLRHLVIREGKNTGQRMVKLVAKSTTPFVDELAERLKNSSIPITTFIWAVHDGLSDVATGGHNKIYWGEGTIQEKMGHMTVRVTPNSFLQTNTHAAEQMLNVLKSWMTSPVILNEVKDLPSLPKRDSSKIIDLYCGSGTIGLNLSERETPLVGIETNRSAVEEAQSTASENGYTKAEFIVGAVEKLIDTHPSLKPDAQTWVVVDPPRPGLHPTVLEALNRWAVPHLFYVSCNPESLKRDLRGLSSKYTIEKVQPMDFFPHTDHVETAVHLSLSF